MKQVWQPKTNSQGDRVDDPTSLANPNPTGSVGISPQVSLPNGVFSSKPAFPPSPLCEEVPNNSVDGLALQRFSASLDAELSNLDLQLITLPTQASDGGSVLMESALIPMVKGKDLDRQINHSLALFPKSPPLSIENVSAVLADSGLMNSFGNRSSLLIAAESPPSPGSKDISRFFEDGMEWSSLSKNLYPRGQLSSDTNSDPESIKRRRVQVVKLSPPISFRVLRSMTKASSLISSHLSQ